MTIRKDKLFIALMAVFIAVLLNSMSGCYKHPESKTADIEETTSEVKIEVVYEAEDGILKGTEESSETSGYSGNGYVTGFDNDEDSLEVEVKVLESGLYNLIIGYSSPHDNKTSSLFINSEPAGDIILKKTSEFTELPAVKVMMNEGINSIKILKGWGWYDIDYIKVQSASSTTGHNISKTLVNPNATKEARALMSYLADNYRKKIISGQQDYKYIQWIRSNTGKKPAILGLDFIDYSPSRKEHGASSNHTQKAIEWWEEGGIVTFCWHWNAPKDLIDEPGKEWWRGFYTEATNFDVDYALKNPESEDYKLIIRDIDAIAEQLKILQESKVPVLWRPLHEAGGKWFWWGAKGPEACKKLYLLLFERLTDYHGLDNLIWVWSTPEPEWYPGNEYVDIVGYDSYPSQGGYHPAINMYENMSALVKKKKIVTMSENGPIPDPDKIMSFSAGWSWFCTWGDMISDSKKNELEHVKKVYNHEYVITLDELPDIKKYID